MRLLQCPSTRSRKRASGARGHRSLRLDLLELSVEQSFGWASVLSSGAVGMALWESRNVVPRIFRALRFLDPCAG